MKSTKPGQKNASVPLSLSPKSSALISHLFDDHADKLRRYVAARFGPEPPEAEEIVQAAFVKLASMSDIEAIRDPRAFLYSIACNLVISYRRAGSRHDAVRRDMQIHDGADDLSDFSPERVLLAKEQLNLVERAMRKMPKMRRRIFLMVRVEGSKPADVARQFGITENAVHRHVSRGLADVAAAFAAIDRSAGTRP